MANNKWWTLLIGILIGLFSAAILLIVSSPPRGEAIQLPDPPTPPPIMVDISGEIASPGLYTLPIGSRVADLIELAGGLYENAHLETINLAQILIDGQRVYIASVDSNVRSQSSNSSTNELGLVNINTANISELVTLSGIGEGKALDIISYRTQNGAFSSIQDIKNVSGIGDGIFNSIKNQITISPVP